MDDRQIFDTWERGGAYERYIGRWSRRIAPRFLAWMDCAAGLRWLDVGCGTGALCAAILEQCSPGSVAGVEPSDGFRKMAEQNLAGRAALYPGSAAEIPLGASTVDVVVSGLVLNFVPDPRAALAEMARVTAPGGSIGAYVWDYADKMELIKLFWEAAAAIDPRGESLDEGARFPLCSPTALAELFRGGGLREVATTSVETQAEFASFDDYWQPFLGGQGPGPAYVMALDERDRARLRDHLRGLIPTRADGSITLTARAWAVRGVVVK
jgi:SAM-dependent methyltransferase